jgi:hypothetical protein
MVLDSKPAGRKPNLNQYRPAGGKWQFVPVVKVDGKPKPQLVLIGWKPVSWKGGGKRKTMIAGAFPREAMEQWQLKTGELSGTVESLEDQTEDTGDKLVTIDHAIEKYLREVETTKGNATMTAYRRDLRWFRTHCEKHYFTQLERDDIIALFGAGRGQEFNQKTINRSAMVTLQAMRGAGVRVELKKGDWPKTIEAPVEVHEQEKLNRSFAACEPAERLLFHVFLCTGFRSREVATLKWDDVNWKAGTLAVHSKSELGFTPNAT